MIAPYLASSFVNRFKPENRSQSRLIKDPNLTKIIDFKTNGGKPVTIYSNMLTFKDTNRTFKFDGDFLETITNYDFNVDHSNQQDRKLIYEFGKEMKIDNKQKGRKIVRDKSVIRLLKSPIIMASGISKTVFLSFDPTELCGRLKLSLQKNMLEIILNEEIVAIVDKLLEYNCISKKQHKQLLIKCNLL